MNDEPMAFLSDCFCSLEDWESGKTESLHARWRLNSLVPAMLDDSGWAGYCNLCRKPVHFLVPSVKAGGSPDLREELICSGCGISARGRAGLTLATQSMDGHSHIYITEQASKAFVWLQSQPGRIIGSEFEPAPEARDRLAERLRRMGGRGEIRFEDVTDLTFDTGLLDAVVSFDVLEHVPDYRKALREFCRVLKPGGMLVLTVPFRPDCADTIVRARVGDDGRFEHLLEPEYHGDPLGAGVLCIYHFGWDLVDEARRAGFSTATMMMPWAPSMGMFSGLWTLVAHR